MTTRPVTDPFQGLSEWHPQPQGSGEEGDVIFVSDLRLAFACPSCRKLVWIAGA